MIYGPDGKLIGSPAVQSEPARLIGITRSFSFKLNLGNYESADFFCSQRAECDPAMAEEVSRDLDQFCQDEVRQAIIDFRARRAEKKQPRSEAA